MRGLRAKEGVRVMIADSKWLRMASSALLWLVVGAGAAAAQLPNCNCYFNRDCTAETPICQLTLSGTGSTGPDDPNRACEWREPKPTGGPGTGCDQPYSGGPPCDGICVAGPAPFYEQYWDHWDGRPGYNYTGSGCLPGGPYPYFIKFVVENEPCDLPSHCSLCETEISIPANTLAEETAAIVASALAADCSAAGFSFDLFGRRVYAEIQGQIFDVCVNGVKVASSMSPVGQALVCQDGVDPTTHQTVNDFVVVPALSRQGFALLVGAILAVAFAMLARRAAAKRS